MEKNTITSPVVQDGKTRKVDEIRASDIKTLYQKHLDIDISDSFHGVENISILECCTTGYRFFYPYNVAGDGLFYEKVQIAMQGNNEYYREWGYDHAFAYKMIQKDDHVLDIGCGTGNFLKKIKDKTSNVSGLELNKLAVEQCRADGLTVYPDLIDQHAQTHQNKYDVVCLFQVLEHIHDIRSFMESSLAVLKKNGKLIIGVPNNEPYMQGYHKYSTMNLPPHHMGLWNRKAFENIQPVFNIKLTEVGYEAEGRWTLNAYYRAKYMLNIKSFIHQHTILEKLGMVALSPLTIPLSLFQKATRGINGAYIVVVFEKK